MSTTEHTGDEATHPLPSQAGGDTNGSGRHEAVGHAVQFYEDDNFLCTKVADFVGAGLAAGDPVLVVATDAHNRVIQRHLETRAFDVERAVTAGLITILDAEATLAALFVGEEPSQELFDARIAGLVRQLRARHGERQLCAYGEMVDLLWSRGCSRGAVRLEEMWNELKKNEQVSLLCGYALGSFRSREDAAVFDGMCRLHSSVQPAETYTDILDEDARRREVARLQRRARALDAEIQRREELERELRRREATLRTSEVQLQAMLHQLTIVVEQMPAGVAIVEAPSGKILMANRKSDEVFGRPVAGTESIEDYRSISALHADGRRFEPEDWPITRSIRTGAVIQGEELHIVRANGEHAYVRVSSSPVRDATGKIVAGVAITEDISEQKRAALAAREQDRINETLLTIAASLNTELDLDVLVSRLTEQATALCRAEFGAFFYNVVNDTGESYMLYTLAGAAHDAFSKFPMPRNTAVFKPTFDGTDVVRLDDVTKDPRFGKNPPFNGLPEGHLPVRSYLAVPVRSRSGDVLGGLFFGHARPGVFREADERLLVAVSAHAAVAIDNATLFNALRRAEAAAQEERRKLHELFMQSPALIVILRGRDHVYDFVNAAALPFVGHDDPVGKPLREVRPDLPQERVALLDQVLRTGERYVEEAVSSVRDWKQGGHPHERFFNIVHEPYRRSDGTIQGVMSFAFEVTEQVRAKQKLESIACELENANRTKDEFLATVSHELRTPLNAILGWARMLRTAGLPPEKQERALETIERNANAQTQLIEDLLDVSRIISGKLRLDVGTVDLPTVIENAIDAVRPAAHAKGVTLRQTVDPDAAPILGDAERLQQVAWNLLTNAVKFTPKGGVVTTALRKRESSIDIVVTDTGQGIASDFLPNVFERFRQADASTARKQGGLGLGLAIVRHLVELHGGTVSVDSEGLGKGATFTVSLPISPPRAASLERPPPLRMVTGATFTCPQELVGIHVLVVDDEPDVRDLLAEMLTRCNARVVTAASTAEALQLVQDLRPDVIVSDIGMPGEDGYALIQRLRALPASHGGRTPAVALTAYARFEDRTKALVAGFNMHVPKPVEPTELIAVLASLAKMFAGA